MSLKEHTALNPFKNLSKTSHICHFYKDYEELLEALLLYFQAGLPKNEKCILIHSKSFCLETASKMFEHNLSDFSRLLDTRQLEIINYDDLKSDFTPKSIAEQKVFTQWNNKIPHSDLNTFNGLRIAANLPWINFESMIDCENYFYDYFRSTHATVLCSYSLRDLTISDIMNISHAQHFALVKQNSIWSLQPPTRHRDPLWQSLWNVLGCSIMLVDNSGNIITASNACLKLFNCNTVPELGATLEQFVDKFKIKSITGQLKPEALNIIYPDSITDYWLATAHSDELRLVVDAKPTYSNIAKFPPILLSFHDIDNLGASKAVETDFLQIVAHEIKNPVQTLKALFNLIEMHPSEQSSSILKYIQLAKPSLDKITTLVEDLQSIGSRPKDNDIDVNIIPIDFNSLLMQSLEPYLTASQHVFICKHDENAVLPMMADPIRIRQIIGNILANAVKYTPQGKRIWIDLTVSKRLATLTVEDEGIGIPPKELDHVFKQFYRGQNVKHISEGMGLGLYVSKCLAKMHGGNLWAEPRYQGGIFIKLSLPLIDNADEIINELYLL